MTAFVYLFIYRTLSGVQNGFGYAEHRNGTTYTSLLLALLAWLPLLLVPFSSFIWPLKALAITGAIISTIGALGVWDNFSFIFNRFPVDIHFWELWITTGVTLCWIALGGNLYMVAAHVYPALLLHKGAVNIGSDLSFWDTRTDDATGKTFNIPLLNIRIPRLGLRGRQALAVLSLLGAGFVYWKGYSFTILNIL
ncbi:MAG: hypothetical protein AAFO02_15480 [Bacteroidota bacterium]